MNTKSILSVLVISLMMLSGIASTVSAYEVRGAVYNQADGGDATKIWNPQNFAGFYYDIDSDVSTEEELAITDGISSTDRVIAKGGLTYTTTAVPVKFEFSTDKGGRAVYQDGTEAVINYSVVGWQAEKWVALTKNSASKLVKLVTEYKDGEKVSLSTGQTLELGKGYTLKIQSVDAKASPRQAWISLAKDGKTVDEGIVQQNESYTFRKTVGGEADSLVFAAFVSTIFSGGESDMIQLQYLWLIDEASLIEIKSGDSFGVFKATINGNTLKLESDSAVSLSKNTDITLMGNMKFKVANSETLRFYPYVDITTDGVKVVETTKTPVVTAVPTAVPTAVVTAVPVPVPTTAPAPVAPAVVAPVVTATPAIQAVPVVAPVEPVTATPATPGFSALFAIAGLFAVTFLVLRQKNQ